MTLRERMYMSEMSRATVRREWISILERSMMKISRRSSSSMIAKGRARRADHAATRYRKRPKSKLDSGAVEGEMPQDLACRVRLEVESSDRAREINFDGLLVRG